MNYRAIWLSDLHLGTRACNAAGLLEFLREHDAERFYLVGDVIDLWRLRKSAYWPQLHNDVVQKLLRKARKGAQLVVIPGNHDEFHRNFVGTYGNIRIQTHDIHTTRTGQRLLVLHGHEFDMVTMHARWLACLGDTGYTMLLLANQPLNFVRRLFGLDHWSLSACVKRKVKHAVNFVSQYEEAVARYAARFGVDGIICGHIHTPAIKQIRGLAYYNTGDWVESSTALVEHFNGRIELIRWRSAPALRPLPEPMVAEPELVA